MLVVYCWNDNIPVPFLEWFTLISVMVAAYVHTLRLHTLHPSRRRESHWPSGNCAINKPTIQLKTI